MSTPRDSFGLTALLGLMIALTSIAVDSSLPAMPEFARALHGDAGAAQLTLTALFAGIAAGQLLWGPLSDRYGRKPALVAGLALALASGASCAAAPNLAMLAASRFVQGIAVSVGPVLSRTVARDLYSHEHAARLLSRVMVVFSVAPIAAPLIGGELLALFGWRAVFVFHALVAATLLAAAWRGLKETAPAGRQALPWRRLASGFAALLGDRRFLAPFLVLLAGQMGILAWIVNSPFALVRGLGVTPRGYALLFALVMLGQVFGAYASARMVMRRGIPAMLRIGTRLAFTAGAAMLALDLAGVRHWSAVVAPMILYIFASSFIVPHATAAALSPFARRAGTASSLMGAIQFACGAALGALLGALFQGSARPMIVAVACAGLATLVFERMLLARPGR
jgi:DHA1 family bicyclomycin/chloramphenicol resistance-like MFS transporter